MVKQPMENSIVKTTQKLALAEHFLPHPGGPAAMRENPGISRLEVERFSG
jgi:hypothetical protein